MKQKTNQELVHETNDGRIEKFKEDFKGNAELLKFIDEHPDIVDKVERLESMLNRSSRGKDM